MDKLVLTSKEEIELILSKRRELEERGLIKEKQRTCTHSNKIYEGRFGHNGDDWYFCPTCNLNWYE